MRILHVVPELKLAGAQIMVENLSNELAKLKCEVNIASLYSEKTPITQRLSDNKIKVHFLGKKNGLDLSMILKLRQLIKTFRPDIIHTHSYVLKYVMAAKLGMRKLPVVHTIHNLADKETTRSNLKLEKLFFKYFNVCPVAISPIIRESVSEFYALQAKRIPMIFNGVNLDGYIPKKNYTIDNTNIKIIHIGRFEEQKNHKKIIEAARILKTRCPYVKFDLYGEGPLKEEIKNIIKQEKLEDTVRIAGLTSSPNIELTKSDIFILPSNWEGMPITLIEAMATGLPIIVTPVGGIPDMVSNGESALIIENAPGDLANAICTLVKNKQLREYLGKNALNYSKYFSSEMMAKEYLNLYENVMKKVD